MRYIFLPLIIIFCLLFRSMVGHAQPPSISNPKINFGDSTGYSIENPKDSIHPRNHPSVFREVYPIHYRWRHWLWPSKGYYSVLSGHRCRQWYRRTNRQRKHCAKYPNSCPGMIKNDRLPKTYYDSNSNFWNHTYNVDPTKSGNKIVY